MSFKNISRKANWILSNHTVFKVEKAKLREEKRQ